MPVISTSDELAHYRTLLEKRRNQIFAIVSLIGIAAAVVAPTLTFTIPRQRVPFFLQRIWDPAWLIALTCFIVAPVIQFLLIGKRSRPQAVLLGAVAHYDDTIKRYNKYRVKGHKESLLRSYLAIEALVPVFTDLPEFREWREAINASYDATFLNAAKDQPYAGT